MKPFSLHVVLKYRKRMEDIAQNRLFEARKVQEIIEAKLFKEKNDLEDLIHQTEQLQFEGIQISDLILYEERIERAKDNIVLIEKNLVEKEKIVEKEFENLVHRSKERQIMERLKEQQNKTWKLYLDKKEAAMLDELTTTRHELTEKE